LQLTEQRTQDVDADYLDAIVLDDDLQVRLDERQVTKQAETAGQELRVCAVEVDDPHQRPHAKLGDLEHV
jgi:hypothetical protein